MSYACKLCIAAGVDLAPFDDDVDYFHHLVDNHPEQFPEQYRGLADNRIIPLGPITVHSTKPASYQASRISDKERSPAREYISPQRKTLRQRVAARLLRWLE